MHRKDNEPPEVISGYGWRYHHMGIPTDIPRPGEVHLEHLGMHVSGFKTSPFGIEWMRFDEDSPVSDLVRTVPHIAFEVDNLESALKEINEEAEITSPPDGVRVAMIVHNSAPVELIEFDRSEE
jgi:hypothetical protein